MVGFAGGLLQGMAGGVNARNARADRQRELSAMEALGQSRGHMQPGISLPMDGQDVASITGQGDGGGRAKTGMGSNPVRHALRGVDPAMERKVIQGLIDRGMSPHQAKGVAANMIAESRLDTGINEIAPLVKGSRGGYGLNQWTGPRRRAIEAEAARRGVALDDLDFQLDYTMYELQGPESRAWKSLQGAQTAEEAARIYSEQFLRPGIPHLESRVAHARRLEKSWDKPQATAPTAKKPDAGATGATGGTTNTWAWMRQMQAGAGR